MKRFLLYTHDAWRRYSWESLHDSRHMEWEIRRCHYGDPHPPPPAGATVFYTDSELSHALVHRDVRKIAFMLESRRITPGFYDHLEACIDAFDAVLTYDAELLGRHPERCVFYPHGNCLVGRQDFGLHDKSKLVSFISSTKRMGVSGHELRHEFHRLYSEPRSGRQGRILGDVEVELYGALAGRPIEHKVECLKDYMFHVAIENCVLDTYFTEKILDCFVTGTIPIYCGTGRIVDFFDPRGMLRFSTVDELFEILGSLTPESYAERRDAVARNFERAQQYVLPEDWIHANTDLFTASPSL